MSAAVSSGVRLDIYHPTLNTGISDIRIQDAVLEYPIVRALIIPECDLEARRRCIGLISNVIKAANPVLHFVLLQQKQKVDVVEHYNTLTQFLSTVPTKESLVRFWFMHYMEEVRNEVIKVYGHADKLKPSPASTNSGAAIAKISLTALYAKIRRSRERASGILWPTACKALCALCFGSHGTASTRNWLAEIVRRPGHAGRRQGAAFSAHRAPPPSISTAGGSSAGQKSSVAPVKSISPRHKKQQASMALIPHF